MNAEMKKVRALGLCSGGLDSILAALVLRSQGIEVEWVSFETPFFTAEKATKASQQTGIPLRIQDITVSYLEMLKDPHCGYGQHMNPCLDCHALMFRHAGRILKEEGFDFLFSGEVVGQRPMSQTKPSLRYVEKNSGVEGWILRPLSARLLAETLPEQQGLVDREKLLDISGRGRKRQIELATQFGVTDYPAPAGGCLLTDKGYSLRLRDLFDHSEGWSVRDLHMLKLGRHFRLGTGAKLVVGRSRGENDRLLELWASCEDVLFKTRDFPGPIALIPRGASREKITLAAAICAGYSKAPDDRPVQVDVTTPEGQEAVTVLSISPGEIKHLLISG